MTIEKQANALQPRPKARDEIPTVPAAQGRSQRLSFTRYFAPPEEHFCSRLWAEYKRHAQEQTRGRKK